jgi:hypothetical protein
MSGVGTWLVEAVIPAGIAGIQAPWMEKDTRTPNFPTNRHIKNSSTRRLSF